MGYVRVAFIINLNIFKNDYFYFKHKKIHPIQRPSPELHLVFVRRNIIGIIFGFIFYAESEGFDNNYCTPI